MSLSYDKYNYNYYWGAMGNCNIMEFVLSTDNHYLFGKFSNHNNISETDYYDISNCLLKELKKQLVDEIIFYEGSALARISVIPEWESYPKKYSN